MKRDGLRYLRDVVLAPLVKSMPAFAVTIGATGVGNWVLYATISRPAPTELGIGWISVLGFTAFLAVAFTARAASSYKESLHKVGPGLAYPMLIFGVMFFVPFGLFMKNFIDALGSLPLGYALPFICFYVVCVLITGWFTKIPFDVALKIHDDAKPRFGG